MGSIDQYSSSLLATKMMPRELQLPISTTSSTRTTNILNPSANPNPNHRHRHHYQFQESNPALGPPAPRPPQKKKRNLPGTPDPDADVIAMSPRALMATNKFLCEICGKGFQRDQNLQLHRRGHNLPWKLKQRSTKEMKKKVYVCPEKTCVHHDPCRALGDLTGIKKHFSRKHGEKKWKCDKCSKKYAVMSDWKAHSKTCGTREYKCDCGTIFSRKDSFVTHRAFCDALTEENMRKSSTITTAISAGAGINGNHNQVNQHMCLSNMYVHDQKSADLSLWLNRQVGAPDVSALFNPITIPGRTTGVELLPTGSSLGYASEMLDIKDSNLAPSIYSSGNNHSSSGGSLTHMSATALLQKAAQMGAGVSNSSSSMFAGIGAVMAGSVDKTVNNENSSTRTGGNMGMRIGEMPMGWNIDSVGGSLTRDFLGLGGDDQNSSCRPLFSPQELAKIASMGNDMELITSPYNGNRR